MKKTYVITDKAGVDVAGFRLSGEVRDGQLKPIAGQTLELTDEQAEYELREGVIVLAPESKPAKAR